MAEPTPQRAWRALCTSCGAPVEFRSAASPMAVCTFCRSTLVRDGEALRRIGHSAELFDDHSPLQLGVTGRFQGESFTLVGRIQMAYAEGTWSEWHALFDNGRSAWLSEDNAGYVMSLPVPADAALNVGDVSRLRPGASVAILGRAWQLASVTEARVQAAEGELAFAPDFEHTQHVLELRNSDGEVCSIELSAERRLGFIGRAVELPQLKLSGLRESSVASLRGEGVSCPNCGAALAPKLGSTQSMTCASCRSVVDLSAGVGGALSSYQQDNALDPLIPLGSTGMLSLNGTATSWQVVGYQERCDVPASSDDEQIFWREYLLYNQQAGFAFLVDAEDGWSMVRPLTGAPAGREEIVTWSGVRYRKKYTYTALTTHVLGEFYWRVQKDQRSLNTDYSASVKGRLLSLNREQTEQEVVWSAGESVPVDVLMKAFGVKPGEKARFDRGAGASALTGTSRTPASVWLYVGVMLLVVLLMWRCSSDDCDQVRDTYGAASTEYQQCQRSGGGGGYHGGSWGGYSSGGSHK